MLELSKREVFMKRIILFLFLVIFIIGCAEEVHIEKEVFSEKISDDAELITTEGTYQGKDFEKSDIKYKKDGEEFQNYFDPQFRDSLDWIKENVKEGVFLSWWDYGHMIRGYAGRDVVIFSPSEAILWSLASGKWDEEGSGRFSTKEQINDVTLALTTIDAGKTKEVMEKYNAEYVFVTERDIASSYVLFEIAGLDDYYEGYKPKEKAMSTILFRMVNKETIEGFSLVYSDNIVRIYKLNN